MSAVDQLKELFDKALEMHREYSAMSANFKNLEHQFDLLVQANERLIERLGRDNEDLRRRVTALEGLTSTILASSTKEAIVQLQREHLEKHGTIAPVGLPSLPDTTRS